MSRPDSKAAAPSEPYEPQAEVPRSGAGAGSALFAMLKKRQMRATRDAEPDAEPARTQEGANGEE
ncbi:MAG: hypothetical protein JWP43_924 [Ramlibacter sp.]|jgi:hypothetical protein|nr:hypothetical protein [Ramlibacter sp.]